MKYIKKFENNKNNITLSDLQIGDYVYCKNIFSHYTDKIHVFLRQNIGKITKFEQFGNHHYTIVKFENKVPRGISAGDNSLRLNDKMDIVIAHSKNKEDLEMYITMDKYNL